MIKFKEFLIESSEGWVKGKMLLAYGEDTSKVMEAFKNARKVYKDDPYLKELFDYNILQKYYGMYMKQMNNDESRVNVTAFMDVFLLNYIDSLTRNIEVHFSTGYIKLIHTSGYKEAVHIAEGIYKHIHDLGVDREKHVKAKKKSISIGKYEPLAIYKTEKGPFALYKVDNFVMSGDLARDRVGWCIAASKDLWASYYKGNNIYFLRYEGDDTDIDCKGLFKYSPGSINNSNSSIQEADIETAPLAVAFISQRDNSDSNKYYTLFSEPCTFYGYSKHREKVDDIVNLSSKYVKNRVDSEIQDYIAHRLFTDRPELKYITSEVKGILDNTIVKLHPIVDMALSTSLGYGIIPKFIKDEVIKTIFDGIEAYKNNKTDANDMTETEILKLFTPKPGRKKRLRIIEHILNGEKEYIGDIIINLYNIYVNSFKNVYPPYLERLVTVIKNSSKNLGAISSKLEAMLYSNIIHIINEIGVSKSYQLLLNDSLEFFYPKGIKKFHYLTKESIEIVANNISPLLIRYLTGDNTLRPKDDKPDNESTRNQKIGFREIQINLNDYRYRTTNNSIDDDDDMFGVFSAEFEKANILTESQLSNIYGEIKHYTNSTQDSDSKESSVPKLNISDFHEKFMFELGGCLAYIHNGITQYMLNDTMDIKLLGMISEMITTNFYNIDKVKN